MITTDPAFLKMKKQTYHSFEQAADTGLTLIDLGMSDSSFFRNAKDGDFTIINTGSTVYTQEYGDPRWITVSEY